MSKKNDFQNAADAYNRQDYETAYKLYLPLAEQGYADVQNFLGIMYSNGKVFCKTIKKQSSGIDFLQNKVMQKHNSAWH